MLIGRLDLPRRRDVLRRHYLRCSARGQNPIPGKLKKGKKSTACDGCARLKAGCDRECPCETCLSYGITCTYTRVQQGSEKQQQQPPQSPSPRSTRKLPSDISSSGNSIFSTPCKVPEESSSSNSRSDREASHPGTSKVSLEFLLNYANPDNTTIPDAFRPALTRRRVSSADPETLVASSSTADTFEDPSSLVASSAASSSPSTGE